MNSKLMKRILSLILAASVLASVLIVSAAYKYPEPSNKFFVNDYADVIDASSEEEIYSRAAALYEKTTAQVVVLTVKTLDGIEPVDYATDVGDEWGVGTEKDDNGIVILLSSKEREIFIAVGKGLEGALPDSKTGRIIDNYGLEYLRADDFSTGLTEIAKAIINEAYIEYGEEPEMGYTPIDEYSDVPDGYGKKVGISWVTLILFVILYVIFFGRRGRRRGGFFWLGGPPFGGGGFGGFSGGSFGGGRGGFGGGGGFSGGGGSFGGGGAGRGF